MTEHGFNHRLSIAGFPVFVRNSFQFGERYCKAWFITEKAYREMNALSLWEQGLISHDQFINMRFCKSKCESDWKPGPCV